ncbi:MULTISPECIES: YbaK/EbsC family protein [unclassified Enterococcus]|uniref:YbaK/EbsC family protein n=1 Tax=unclassified Enterococcus TaxID=2608891 RepID=UPI0015529EE0|nr:MULTISPECIES: YbaK/EbsC family protein [unclassified Enterococcus]MBS7576486.1 DNA-binding protein [Enterococcus sp. MMGLQ5-2]MBS7583718.1 DNA-binding protein [Enterococcus sp. MMGLQ5-1]NPD11579.1 DNA-binding protein [Enterococcus sp. MMGLQ5-1]NPD36323.1 DNA-binding protein [Enterococcus sp. MMGLQ5-2]
MISEIEALLMQHKISYKKYHHHPVYTADEARLLGFDETVLEIKNLFLRNKNKSEYYLFCLPFAQQSSIAELALIAHEKKLSFACEDDLSSLLGVHSGAVSLLNIINDEAKAVNYYIEQTIIEHAKVAFHPNRNDQTLIFDGKKIPKLLNYCSITRYHFFSRPQ